MFVQGNAARLPFRDASVDLVFGSPPYSDARLYDMGFNLDCRQWVEWLLPITAEAMRVSRGLVCWVVAGVQREGNYWPGPEGLVWEWFKRGGQQWCPSIWIKKDDRLKGTGIPGSGGRQGLRKDFEYIVMFKRPGPLPWSDNTACGWTPAYNKIGGEMSNRNADGRRVNDPWRTASRGGCNIGGRLKDGSKKSGDRAERPADGIAERQSYRGPPKLTNPGNVIVLARVGGNQLGDKIAHEGEAPFPERLAETFILSYCPPGGTVLDTWSGSGTTVKVATQLGRVGIGLDIRSSQCLLGLRRCKDVQLRLA